MSSYELNRLLYDLREPKNRTAILADQDEYLNRYSISDEEKQLIRDGEWQELVDRGVSIYVLTKIGATIGVSLYEMGAKMRGGTIEEFWEYIAEQNQQVARYALLP